MKPKPHIPALLSLLLLLAAGKASAQIASPDKLIAPAPRNPAAHAAADSDDLQWMWAYASSGDKQALLVDLRFDRLLHHNLRAPQAFWSAPGSPLVDAAHAFLGGPGGVAAEANREILITGCIVDRTPDADTVPCAQRGLLLVDFAQTPAPQPPRTVFAALRWNEQGRSLGRASAPYTLWLFPSRPFAGTHLPSSLRHALTDWLAAKPCAAGTVNSVILVDADGVPHILGTLDAIDSTSICTSPAAKATQP